METSVDNEEQDTGMETRCGVLGMYPKWLQVLASKKTYVILFGLVGLNQLAISSYGVATITTIEKRFKIPSQTSGILTGAWDVGTICSSITMAYIGSKGHKTRWVAFGTLLVSLACYAQLLPYVIYGPGSDALAIASSGNTTTKSMSTSSFCDLEGLRTEDCHSETESAFPPILIFLSQIALGVGTSMYWTLGMAYLDDNVTKTQAPWLIAISSTIRLFGSPLGYWVAARALELYADPTLSPPITDRDPRWIGAWWLGWIPFGVIATFYAVVLTLFPRILPRAAQRLKKQNKPSSIVEKKKKDGFKQTLARLLKNPLLICNTFAYVFYMFGVVGYWVFMPKYMETQFHMTASDANQVTGTMGLISSAFGVVGSGYVVSKFKPSARKIAGYNFVVEVLGVVSVIIYIYLGCPKNDFHGSWSSNGSWNLMDDCNNNCNCGPSISYEPVCDPVRSLTFYSPCHAGCTDSTYTNGSKVFTNCSCIPGSLAIDSFCPVDCSTNLMIFLILYGVISFLSSSSHAGLVIIQFRTVDPDDKSISMAMSEMMCAAISYIPGPIVYGYLVDSACLIWDKSCGEQGNCWLYNAETLPYYFNYTAAGFLTIALLFDFGVWYFSTGLDLYDESDSENDSYVLKETNVEMK